MNKPLVTASTQRHVASDATEFADRDLVNAARSGDRGAFRSLYERYHRRLFAVAVGVLRNPADAQDVVQDGFVKAYRYLDKFEGNSSFYTWMYRIVMNLAIDHIRKHKRSRPVEANDEHLREGNTDVINQDLLPLHLGSNPSRMLFDKQVRARLEAALGQLSENHRAVLVMRELDGLSYEDMASIMSCSKGTIMSRLFHARRNMQRQLSDLVDGASVPANHDDGGDANANGDNRDNGDHLRRAGQANETSTATAKTKTEGRTAAKPQLAKSGGAS